MSIQQLFKIENGVPQWFNVMLWALYILFDIGGNIGEVCGLNKRQMK